MEHWTIWARKAMDHAELCQFIKAWLNARKPHNVIAWNYDDNRQMRTIDVWHVHIYFQGADGELPKFCISSASDAAPGAKPKGFCISEAMAPLDDVTVMDVARHFSPNEIGKNLSKLWTARGCELETALSETGSVYICPLTSCPVRCPILLDDGCIYEDAAM
eukprot:g24216.t1